VNNFKRTVLAVNAEADAVCRLLDGGSLDLYDGSQPGSADSPITTQVRLSRMQFGSPAFFPASNGIAKANTMSADPAAEGTGTATWFRAVSADGRTVFDGSVGKSDADVIVNTADVVKNAIVSLASMSYTAKK
jgi:hypothetical protein